MKLYKIVQTFEKPCFGDDIIPIVECDGCYDSNSQTYYRTWKTCECGKLHADYDESKWEEE